MEKVKHKTNSNGYKMTYFDAKSLFMNMSLKKKLLTLHLKKYMTVQKSKLK